MAKEARHYNLTIPTALRLTLAVAVDGESFRIRCSQSRKSVLLFPQGMADLKEEHRSIKVDMKPIGRWASISAYLAGIRAGSLLLIFSLAFSMCVKISERV
jgi:hypothetical protein